jgi:hypothetical protein
MKSYKHFITELKKDTVANYVVKRFGLDIVPPHNRGSEPYLIPSLDRMKMYSKLAKSVPKYKRILLNAPDNMKRASDRLVRKGSDIRNSAPAATVSRKYLEPAAVRMGILDPGYWNYQKEFYRGKK